MRRSFKFFQRGSNFFSIFLVNEWIQIQLKSSHHQPARETPFKWHFAGVPMMVQHWMLASLRGSRPVMLRDPIFLWFFRGGGGSGPPVPPLDLHMKCMLGVLKLMGNVFVKCVNFMHKILALCNHPSSAYSLFLRIHLWLKAYNTILMLGPHLSCFENSVDSEKTAD